MDNKKMVIVITSYYDWTTSSDYRAEVREFSCGMTSAWDVANILRAHHFNGGLRDLPFEVQQKELRPYAVRPCGQACLIDADKVPVDDDDILWLICQKMPVRDMVRHQYRLLSSKELHKRSGWYASVGGYILDPVMTTRFFAFA